MAVVLPDLIDPAQGAFVKGRSISENILVAQELIRGYARKRISPRCMIMVDIRKAYDTRNNGTNHNAIPAVKRYLAHTLPGVVKALYGVGGIMAPSLTMYLRLRGTLAHTLPGGGKGIHAEKMAVPSEMGRLISYRCEVPHADPVVSLSGLGNYMVALVLREPMNICGCVSGLPMARIVRNSWRGTGDGRYLA
nr:orf129a gene product [Ipomoea batatas]